MKRIRDTPVFALGCFFEPKPELFVDFLNYDIIFSKYTVKSIDKEKTMCYTHARR